MRRRRESLGGFALPLVHSSSPDGASTSPARGSAVKRAFDVSSASLLLLLLAPVFALVVCAIKLDSRGPAIYRSHRVGMHGGRFHMLKFRKMHEHASGPALTAVRDERFTRLGRILARTKLDELPQLWNVLRGDMSLVGPRPEDPGFVDLYAEEFADVLEVRPGITGLSQLAFAKEGNVLDGPDPVDRYVSGLLPQKIGLDGIYAATRSMRMDLRILLWTFLAVALRVDISVDRRDGRLTVRRRPARPHTAADGALPSEGGA